MRIIALSLAILLSSQLDVANAAVMAFDCNFTQTCDPESGCRASSLVLEFNVDESTGESFVVGNNGLSTVLSSLGENAVTFLETLESGAIQTTTIAVGGSAVHSRHSVVGGLLVPSQFTGECRVFDK